MSPQLVLGWLVDVDAKTAQRFAAVHELSLAAVVGLIADPAWPTNVGRSHRRPTGQRLLR